MRPTGICRIMFYLFFLEDFREKEMIRDKNARSTFRIRHPHIFLSPEKPMAKQGTRAVANEILLSTNPIYKEASNPIKMCVKSVV